jgi:hypothetical protein
MASSDDETIAARRADSDSAFRRLATDVAGARRGTVTFLIIVEFSLLPQPETVNVSTSLKR